MLASSVKRPTFKGEKSVLMVVNYRIMINHLSGNRSCNDMLKPVSRMVYVLHLVLNHQMNVVVIFKTMRAQLPLRLPTTHRS